MTNNIIVVLNVDSNERYLSMRDVFEELAKSSIHSSFISVTGNQ